MAAGKKARVVLAQPAAGALPPRPPALFSRAPGPVRGSGEEEAYRARLRYQALLHDYQEVVQVGSCCCSSIRVGACHGLPDLLRIPGVARSQIGLGEDALLRVICCVDV